MAEVQIAPYGSWRSPITGDLIAAHPGGLGGPCPDGQDVYWTESRPAERGRVTVLRRRGDGEIEEVTPDPINVRSRVHEYGGGAYTARAGVLYYVDFGDQQIYKRSVDGSIARISTMGGARYADLLLDPTRGRLIAVREDHGDPAREAVAAVVAVAIDGTGERVLAEGADFYASPALSADGAHLAWLDWNHPNMPWDGNELWTARIDEDGGLRAPRCVAGSEQESIFQPQWGPDGTLYFVSDRTGWWNLYRLRAEQPEALHLREAEFGLPQWVFGMSTYAVAGDNTLICTFTENGTWYLGLLHAETGELETIDLPYTEYESVRADGNRALFLAGSPVQARTLVDLSLATRAVRTIRESGSPRIDERYLSRPRAISFPTAGGAIAHAFYYPPRNADFAAPAGERPPLLVKSHGGPTAAADSVLDMGIQFWTSRGFAVLDVNYRGSTGYGRGYRLMLDGQWGIADVEDCIYGARYLVEQELADGDRLAIDGGSAGGYTTLCALTFHDTFKAGASYYGISDAEALAQETHKFESRYSDRLIGPYPEERERYRERSPIHFTERIACPIILFQGLDDRVVPPNQAQALFDAARDRGLPVAYLAFEGEGHGFRRAETIKRTLEAELYFYGKVFGFTPADAIEPVPIENLKG